MILRPAFTLGGHGGGIAHDYDELVAQLERGLRESPVGQVLVEESLIGWDEFELEVMRDMRDNVVIVCSIENLDPMGVHTGDSVTVAPQMTLSDEAYQELRNAAAAVIRAVGVETGGSNIQFARERETGELRVIEMNPRVSRSSALATKATGYPIAKVAAKLAVGYTLDEIPNDLTGTTPASFEPTLDYVVVKFPRFAFEKFPGADETLGTQMKSVGEAMGIGRTFTEAFLKAIALARARGGAADAVGRALATHSPSGVTSRGSSAEIDARSAEPSTPRDHVVERSRFADDWIEAERARARRTRRPSRAPGAAQARRTARCARAGLGRPGPLTGRVDSCAAEVEAALQLPLLHLGRGGRVAAARRPSRPSSSSARARTGSVKGSSSTTAASTLRRPFRSLGLRSRDGQLQSRDRLDGLRHVGSPLLRAARRRGGARDLRRVSSPLGVIIQFGGQTPLKLAPSAGGQRPTRFSARPSAQSTSPRTASALPLCAVKLGIRFPLGGARLAKRSAIEIAEEIGYPVLIRPSLRPRRPHDHVESATAPRGGSSRRARGAARVLIDRFLEGRRRDRRGPRSATAGKTSRRRSDGARRGGRRPLG